MGVFGKTFFSPLSSYYIDFHLLLHLLWDIFQFSGFVTIETLVNHIIPSFIIIIASIALAETSKDDHSILINLLSLLINHLSLCIGLFMTFIRLSRRWFSRLFPP